MSSKENKKDEIVKDGAFAVEEAVREKTIVNAYMGKFVQKGTEDESNIKRGDNKG